MKQIHTILLILSSAFLLNSCNWFPNHTVIGTGDVEDMVVEVPAFDGINVTGTCDVEVVTAETQEVVFHAQQEILDILRYEVRDRILHIDFKPGYTVKSSKDISASIAVPELSYLSITGAGDFTVEGDKQESLSIHITGSGNVSAFDMEVADCQIRISGVGNCEVNVSESLDVLISGVGNVYYLGDPQLNSSVSGVGQILPAAP